MFCDLIFLIQRVGSKDIQTHTQTRRAEKRALLKSKIFNLENVGYLILGGKVGFGTPIPQNPDYRQLTSDLQSALASEGKGNRQQK